MSLTISELEAERAKLLEAIESQAQKISSQREPNIDSGHTLKDWLSAAEEVMPKALTLDNSRVNSKQTNQSPTNSSNSMNNSTKTSYLGVIIMLSLMLTVLGVLYVAYITIDKQLQAIKDESIAEIKTLQGSMTELQQTVASGGSPDLFVQLEDKVLVLETKLNAIQTQLELASVKSTTDAAQPILPEIALPISESEQAGAKAQINPITEAVLDQKLAVLEQKIDQKLEIILKHLLQDSTTIGASKTKTQPILAVNEPITPATPVATDTKTPDEAAPTVQETKKVALPTEPAQPTPTEKPLKNYTSDVQWLTNEPPLNYTMQLASTNEQALLKKMIKQHQLTDSKIISQTRNNVKSYVLVSGSFTSRKDADSMAKEFKEKYGIAPWVRRIRDITNRIE